MRAPERSGRCASATIRAVEPEREQHEDVVEVGALSQHFVTATMAPAPVKSGKPDIAGCPAMIVGRCPRYSRALARDHGRVPAELTAGPLSRRRVHVICDRVEVGGDDGTGD